MRLGHETQKPAAGDTATGSVGMGIGRDALDNENPNYCDRKLQGFASKTRQLPYSRIQAVWRPDRDCWREVGSPDARLANRLADRTGRARPFPECGT